jgi:CubicO group peptidase (beta-lactamase class C family)
MPPPAETIAGSQPPPNAQGQDALQATIDAWLVDTGTVGVVVAAILPNGDTITAAGGLADREGDLGLETGASFRIGSITKVYTATLVMQLAEEGLLSVADPVRRYLPQAPAEMTVGQLLNHTSGLRDVDVAAGIFEAIQNADEVTTPDDTISTVLAEPLAFAPGSRQAYSSIGYLVLERVVEAVTGQSYETALQERILGPLGLTKTALERSDSALPTPYERLSPGSPQISLGPISTTNLARAAGAAGALVAPADEVVRFAAALFDTRIVSRETLLTMMDNSNDSLGEFGMGLAVYEVAGKQLYGHNGRTIGFASSLRHDPATAITVVALSNDGSAPTDELADALLASLVAEPGR